MWQFGEVLATTEHEEAIIIWITLFEALAC